MKTRRAALSILLTALSVAFTSVSFAPAEPAPVYRVVVHPANPSKRLSRAFLRDAFLKRARHWPHNAVIHPADQKASTRVRQRFSEEVIGRSVAAVKAYWQQRIFSGRDVPPPEFASDQEVVEYVLSHEGAVGYVSAGVELRGLRVVEVER